MKKALVLLLILAAGGGAAARWYYTRSDSAAQFRLAKIAKGNLRVTVTATGTIQPFLQVQVGTQVSGTVKELKVDFNSKVTAGQEVALIDPAPYQSIVDQNKANLSKAEADVGRVAAGRTQAEKELARAQELAKRELISPSDLDAAVAAFDAADAQLKVANASVEQARATLNQSEVNLRYTTIKSPIDGVVISRNVDVGQTVAASLSAPTIYVIADEMKRIQVQASVSEADIGRIRKDQKVNFSVDAYRETTFKGKVAVVRLSPTTVQNVVTYTVMIEADNPDGKLLPGMTANASFEIEHFENVIKIPNAALRFTPEGAAPAPRGTHRVWLNGPKGPTPVEIGTGASDGAFTLLAKGDLAEGVEVITGIVAEGSDPMNNPFAPRFGGGRR